MHSTLQIQYSFTLVYYSYMKHTLRIRLKLQVVSEVFNIHLKCVCGGV